MNRGQQTPPLVNKLGHTVAPRPLRQGSRLSKESRQRSKHTHTPSTNGSRRRRRRKSKTGALQKDIKVNTEEVAGKMQRTE